MKRFLLAAAVAMACGVASADYASAYVKPANSSGAAVDTGYYAKGTQTKFVCDYEWTETNRKQWLYGNNSDKLAGLTMSQYINGGFKLAWALQNATGNWRNTGINPTTDRATATLDAVNNIASLYKANGTKIYSESIGTSHGNTATLSTALFACPFANVNWHPNGVATSATLDSGCYGTPKIYTFEVYENGALVHFFAPYANGSVVGFKDVVAGTIHENVGIAGTSLTYSDGLGKAEDWKYENGALYSRFYFDVVGGDQGTVTGAADWYVRGTSVTLTAAAHPGCTFAGWSGDIGAITSGNASSATITIDMTRPHRLQATFLAPQDAYVKPTNSSGAAIDTGYYAKGTQTRFVCDYEWTETSRKQWLYGNNSDKLAGVTMAQYINGSVKLAWALQNDVGNWQNMNLAPTTDRATATLDAVNNLASVYKADGTQIYSSAISTTHGNSATLSTALFACPYTNVNWHPNGAATTATLDSGCYGTPKIYAFEVYESGTLVHFFAPYADGSVIGYKDVIAGTIHENVGIAGSTLTYSEGLGKAADWKYESSQLYAKLYVESSDNTLGSVTGASEWYQRGATATLTAVPASSQCIFTGWRGSTDSIVSGSLLDTTITVDMTRPRRLVAVFRGLDETEAVASRWIGAAGNGNLSDAANWASTNYLGNAISAVPAAYTDVYITGDTDFSCPDGSALAYRSLTVDCRLTADADWRGLAAGWSGTIDLNGHEFRLDYFPEDTEITDTSIDTDHPGKFIFENPDAAANGTVTLSGNLRFVKLGGGVLTVSKTGQSYTGGTEIAAGTLAIPASADEATAHYLGANGSPLTVASGAYFNVRGSSGMYIHPVILAGGQIKTDTRAADNTKGFGDITLTADSSIAIPQAMQMIFNADGTMDLGGYTLSMVNMGPSGCNFRLGSTTTNGDYSIINGTLNFTSNAGWLYTDSAVDMRTVDLHSFLTAFRLEADLAVNDYYADYSQQYSYGDGLLSVYGRFTPVHGTYFRGARMMDGSTIDLSGKTGTWSAKSASMDYGSGHNRNEEISFAADATITVDLHGRTIVPGDKVISWSARPAASVSFVLDSQSAQTGYLLAAMDDGLYVANDTDAVVAVWTGLGAADNILDPANWACTNAFGLGMSGALPAAATRVVVRGAFSASVVNGFNCSTFDFDNATLSADCDLGAVAKWKGTLDLRGHRFTAGVLPSEGTVTDTTTDTAHPGELHLVLATDCTNSQVLFTGNLKFVKEGVGVLTVTKAQSYNGGTLVSGGTLKAGGASGGVTNSKEFGTNTSPHHAKITVESGATLDIGTVHTSWGYHEINLDGGTLKGTTTQPNFLLTLTADSTFDSTGTGSDVGKSTNNTTERLSVTLNGHTLTIKVTVGKVCYMGTITGPGTISPVAGGWLRFYSENKPADASKRFDLDHRMAIHVDVDTDVRDYNAPYNANYMNGNAELRVFGTFTPTGNSFYGCTMQDGSAIDLSSKTAVWSVTRTNVDADHLSGKNTVTFADNATVTVKLGDRELEKDAQIIAWTESASTAATVDFQLEPALAKRWKLERTDTGVFLRRQPGTVVLMR